MGRTYSLLPLILLDFLRYKKFDSASAGAHAKLLQCNCEMLSIRDRLDRYCKRDLRASLQKRLGDSPRPDSDDGMLHTTRSAPVLTDTPRAPPFSTFLHYKMSDDAREAAMDQMWIQRRTKEAEQARAEQALAKTMTVWSMNKARLEAEMARRREALRFSSRLGDLHRPQSAAASIQRMTLVKPPSVTSSDVDSEKDEDHIPEVEPDEDDDDDEQASEKNDENGEGDSEDGHDAAVQQQQQEEEEETAGPLSRIAMKGKIWLSPFVNIDFRERARVFEKPVEEVPGMF